MAVEECVFKVTEVGNITMIDNETTRFNFINGENIWGSGTFNNGQIISDGVYIVIMNTICSWSSL